MARRRMKKKNEILEFLASWFRGETDADESITETTDEKLLNGTQIGNRRENMERLREKRPEEGLRELEIKTFGRLYTFLSVLVCAVLAGVLVYTATFLPSFGEADNPGNNEVAEKYLTDTITDTGAVSAVAGMILDYRAFDTLGESFVLFTAVCCVMILLSDVEPRPAIPTDRSRDAILESLVKVLLPLIMLFGIYIILNGHLSPGGGFAGGAIIGAGMTLWATTLGFASVDRFFTGKTFKVVTSAALLFYCVAKSYSFFTGANGLESFIPLGTPGAILSSGLIMPLNVAVGMVVSCTMFGFFSLFARDRI